MGVLDSQLSVKILAISQLSVNFDRSHSQLTVNILANSQYARSDQDRIPNKIYHSRVEGPTGNKLETS